MPETSLRSLPTLWLLGKTGAGKSSLVRFLTANPDVSIGSGFRPCTTTAQAYEFPEEQPWVRFLDTRGLGEASYDPQEDLALCRSQSHALLLCIRLDDPEQSTLINALKTIKKNNTIKNLLVIHTAANQLGPEDRDAAYQHQQQQIEAIWEHRLPNVVMDLANISKPEGAAELQDHLLELLPAAAHLSEKLRMRDEERKLFNQQQSAVRRYATAAAATDALPAIGMITVPSIQAALLRKLAKAYQLEWSRTDLSAFIGTLGTGFGIQYASNLGFRQLVKLLPVYGQTLGSAGAAAISYATTYAIGRVACLYLYHQQQNSPLSPEALQKYYRQAFTRVHQEARDEKTD